MFRRKMEEIIPAGKGYPLFILQYLLQIRQSQRANLLTF